MGRLIPAGTGMKYYRNVKVDPDATENQVPRDEFDDIVDSIRGGLPMPLDLPGAEPDEEVEDVDIETDEIEEEEDFDLDEAMKLDADEDDEI
mgnify:CR=1 FL=1